MLILSRLVNQKIMIGDEIAITVVEIRNGKVRLGIDAPKAIGVHREEVYEAILSERTQSCTTNEVANESPTSKTPTNAADISV